LRQTKQNILYNVLKIGPIIKSTKLFDHWLNHVIEPN